MEAQQFVRCESSPSDESLGVVQYRIAADRNREKELEATITTLGAELAGRNADSKASKTSGVCEGQGDPDREEPVPVETTPESNRNAVREKRSKNFFEKRSTSKKSGAWCGEFKDFREEAVARVHQTNDLLESQEQELLPVQAKMRQMESKIQSLRDRHRAREGQIENLGSRDTALQRTITDAQKIMQESQEELHDNTQTVAELEKETQDFSGRDHGLGKHDRRTKDK